MKRFLKILAAALALAASSSLWADAAATIAKARAYLGSEEALNGVQSIHYVGTIEVTVDKPDAPKLPTRKIEIIVQKPYRQLITITSESILETTALDDYEAWTRVQNLKEPARSRLAIMGRDEVKKRRANVWENLAFYRGIEERRGQVTDQGEVEKEGRKCHLIVFDHGDNLVFRRYFDVETGRLILSEANEGDTIREEGEIHSSGIRFPQKLHATSRLSNGMKSNVTITFEKVTVNEVFPETLFRVPPPSAK